MFKIQNKSDRPEYLFILREPALLALQLVQLAQQFSWTMNMCTLTAAQHVTMAAILNLEI